MGRRKTEIEKEERREKNRYKGKMQRSGAAVVKRTRPMQALKPKRWPGSVFPGQDPTLISGLPWPGTVTKGIDPPEQGTQGVDVPEINQNSEVGHV